MKFSEIKVGSEFEFKHLFTDSDVSTFINLSGDVNPLHHDIEYAKETDFKRPILHGALVSSLFSQLVGVHCPGLYCLYLNQSINYHKPCFSNEELIVMGKVISKHDSLNTIIIKTTIYNSLGLAVSGKATVKILK